MPSSSMMEALFEPSSCSPSLRCWHARPEVGSFPPSADLIDGGAGLHAQVRVLDDLQASRVLHPGPGCRRLDAGRAVVPAAACAGVPASVGEGPKWETSGHMDGRCLGTIARCLRLLHRSSSDVAQQSLTWGLGNFERCRQHAHLIQLRQDLVGQLHLVVGAAQLKLGHPPANTRAAVRRQACKAGWRASDRKFYLNCRLQCSSGQSTWIRASVQDSLLCPPWPLAPIPAYTQFSADMHRRTLPLAESSAQPGRPASPPHGHALAVQPHSVMSSRSRIFSVDAM